MTKTAMQLGRDGGLGGRPEVRLFIDWWSFPNSDIVVFKKLFSKFLIISELNEGQAASVSAVPEVVLQQSPAGPAHQVF